jgi:hypothetical protein
MTNRSPEGCTSKLAWLGFGTYAPTNTVSRYPKATVGRDSNRTDMIASPAR